MAMLFYGIIRGMRKMAADTCSFVRVRKGGFVYVGKAAILKAFAVGFAVAALNASADGLRIAQLCLARQMETPSFCSNYIDRVAALGYNAVQIYITARVETPTFALPPGERYGEEEIRGIVRHASEKGMDVVPYVEIFGHADLFFRHPGLERLAEEARGTPRLPAGKLQTFCFSDPEVREFLRAYLRDLAAIFPGRNVNVGMDEVFNGGICPECRAKDARGELFYEGIMFFHGELAKLGRRMWMWDDFFAYHPGTLERLPRDIMMCHWDYDGDVSDRGSRVGFAGRPRKDDLSLYERLGFDAIVCCWNCPGNAESLFAYARRHRTAGFMVTTWPEMQTSFPPGWLPVNAAVSLLLEQPEKYMAVDPYPDAVRRLMPSLSGVEVQSVASLFRRGPRELALSVLKSSALYRPGAGVADDPFSEAAMFDDFVCRAETEALKERVARIEGLPTDLRRTAADVKAAKAEAGRIAADLRRVAERRRAQSAKWRPGCDPSVSDKECQAIEKRLAGIFELPEAPAAGDEKVLELVLVRPDKHGWALWTVNGLFGDEWRVLADGQWRPQGEGSIHTKRFPFRANAMPTQLRIDYHGYGRGQMAFAAVDDGSRRVVPAKVLSTSGPVEHPERLLDDDFEWADFGTCGFLDKFHFRADPGETASVTLSLRDLRN